MNDLLVEIIALQEAPRVLFDKKLRHNCKLASMATRGHMARGQQPYGDNTYLRDPMDHWECSGRRIDNSQN